MTSLAPEEREYDSQEELEALSVGAGRRIPIGNLYHLLCYAWDFFAYEDLTTVRRDDHRGYTELLLMVLTEGTTRLLKQGLHRDYVALTESMPAIRGKFELAQSIAAGKLPQGFAVCTHDEFTADIPANQILKSTLLRFAGLGGMDKKLADAARRAALRMTGVTRIDADVAMIGRVRIDRNNRAYGFLLSICRLLLEATSVREGAVDDLARTEQRFHKVLENRLPALFEAFVRNFYAKKLKGEGWSRFGAQQIEWVWSELTAGSSTHVPRMITDVTLEHADRKIILDTKFYSSGGLNDRATFESANLYQLHAYVTQLARQAARDGARHPHDHHAEGILLYASTREAEFLHAFDMPPHRMTVASVDLRQPWRAIEARLLALIRENINSKGFTS